ncbi:sensor histidine kinase [Halovenus marina]|uniref:sensor histidine kinase n=1 Tax=Halovenus marina TaxID=3396621 RepID=UPI003F57496D
MSIVETIVRNTEDAFSVTIGTDLPDTAPVVANQALRSVVDNLVENAAEHTGVDDPQIAVEIEADEETVWLFVRDNGPGIPDSEKRTVFDYRPDSTGGGGLFLVKTLVSEYDGDVWVEDNDPRGSTFVVELQRADRS